LEIKVEVSFPDYLQKNKNLADKEADKGTIVPPKKFADKIKAKIDAVFKIKDLDL
jgi:hypothetical protein